MPIKPIILQRRLTEVGRIRIGEVVETRSGKKAPAKLDRFRLTSADKVLLDKVAALYGGEVKAWTPQNGTGSQWEVLTDTAAIPVIVPPQAITQYMEHWSGGGCQRRCDGETELRSGNPCLCAAAEQMICKPTTRLSVMLRDVESIGVFRLESKGWNAAAELPGMAELLAQAGGYITARLYLKPVRQVSDGKTKDFMVPALAVDGVTPAQLLTGKTPAGVAVEGRPELRAIESGASQDWATLARACRTPEQLRDLYREAHEAHELTDALVALFTDRAKQLEPPAVEAAPAVPSADIDTLWALVVAAAPDGWTTPELEAEFASESGGVLPADATAEQMQSFLDHLRAAYPAGVSA